MTQPDLTLRCDSAGERLDRWLQAHGPQALYSRSLVERLIEGGKVLVNGRAARKSLRLNVGDELTVWLPEPAPRHIVPEDVPLDVLYEDEWLAVLNKPAGMSVHPGPGHAAGTFANALAYRFPTLAAGHGPLRPGLVHRLDKDTSGVLLVARDDRTHSLCSSLFKDRLVRKEYAALLLGVPDPADGALSTGIARDRRNRQRMAIDDRGKLAVSHWTVLEATERFCRAQVRIETGRTHQIRVHMASLGCPVLGDRVYGSAARELAALPPALQRRMRAIQQHHLTRQMLHAARISFPHPCREGVTVDVTASLPDDMRLAWEALKELESYTS